MKKPRIKKPKLEAKSNNEKNKEIIGVLECKKTKLQKLIEMFDNAKLENKNN